jgi:hypothetical protein
LRALPRRSLIPRNYFYFQHIQGAALAAF